MSSSIKSAVLVGVDAVEVTITVELLNRLPAVQIVGLPAASVRETQERVRSAMENIGFNFPRHRVVVNIVPVDLPKHGTGLDLPIALALLAAMGLCSLPENSFAFGELSLSGSVRGVRGAYPLALAASGPVIVPAGNAGEVIAAIGPERVVPVKDLLGALLYLQSDFNYSAAALRSRLVAEPLIPSSAVDLADILDMGAEKRALEIAAVGGHSLTLIGSPGCGKTMLARRLIGILPPLNEQQEREVYKIFSAVGLTSPGYAPTRPFRAPHHSVSMQGLIGSATGSTAPGEVTLAHRGVLLLDDAPEFTKTCLNAVRIAHKDGVVRMQRSWATIVYPAEFQLVLTAMACPCGKPGACTCTAEQIARYKSRVPRTDIVVRGKPTPVTAVGFPAQRGDTSAVVAERVLAARERRPSISRGDGRRESVAASIAALAGSARIEDNHLEEARSLCGGT